MNLKDIQALITQGESSNLEFKKTTAQLHATFETLCAFLNGQGGTVLIGVTPSGQIIGQDVSDSTQQEIAREINKFEPPAHIEVSYVTVNTKKVIVLKVQPGVHAPYVYDGRPYQQNQNTTGRMKQHRYEQLLVERGQLNHAWETLLATNFGIDDLDHAEIRRAARKGVESRRLPAESLNEGIEDLLSHWKLLEDGKIINAAVALFAKESLPNYPQCSIRLARFRGIDKQEGFIDSHQLFGNAFKILSEADQFIRRHLPIASFFDPDSFERIDDPTLPVLAVREALVNAICHRDYSHRSGSISLAIFDDRMEIWNTGTLQPGLSLEDLKKIHESYPRNELIASVFYDAGFIEMWGTGTIRMFTLCKEHGLPQPKFSEYSGGFSIQFKFKEPIGVTRSVSSAKPSLSPRQSDILKILTKHGKVKMQDILLELENPPTPRMVLKDLNYLKELGLVDLEGSKRAAFWTVKQKSGQ